MKTKNTTPMKFFGIGKILPFLKPHKQNIFIMIFFGLLGSLVDIILPLFQRYALDHYVGLRLFDTIVWFVIAYVLTLLAASVFNYISCTLATIIEVRIHRDLRQAGFDHLQTLSFSYFNQNSVGYIHARLMSDTSKIGTLVSWTLVDCVWRMSYLIGAIAVMLIINAKLALVEQLIILTLRQFPQVEASRPEVFINRALGYLHSHFSESVTVADAAAYVGYTPNYFNTCFREQMGTPFGVYLRQMRLSYAENLLRSSQMPVTEVADVSGFGSLSYFSRSFCKHYGISPQEYRKNYTEKEG